MLGWFAETTVVATALAAVAALAGRVRPIGPTARHVLWLAVLIKLVTPPMVCWPWAVAWQELEWPVLSRGAEAAGPSAPVSDDGPPSMAPEASVAIAAEVAPSEADPSPGSASPGVRDGIIRALFAGWLAATGLLAAGQGWRILRFRRRLRMAVPAPDDLVEEAGRIAGRLGGRVPEILVVPELGSPMLWCLGRPRLLIPAPLVRSIGGDRWRGILAHELAHLRRGDHWVSRLELLAGLLWWWNPIYWLARARLDAEAELACDAWVVWALPEDRLAYAETLFDIGSRLSRAASPAPALGVAGPGRFLERRLMMILREHVPCRVSPSFLLAAIVLVVLAIPSWSAITPAAEPPAASAPALATPADRGVLVALADDEDDDTDDDDDVDEAKKAEADAKRAAEQAKQAVERAKQAEARAKQVAGRAKLQAEARAKQATDRVKLQAEARARRDEARAKQAAERAKAKAEADAKKAEAGVKKAEADVEKLGSDLEKKMEAFGKDIEKKFGPGSDFEKKMEAFGKDIEKKFGPGSDFEEEMKKLGKEMESKFGPGSDFEKKVKEMGQKMKEKAEAAAKEDLVRARERLEWAKKMKEKGYVSKSQVDTETANLKKAQDSLAKAAAPKAKPQAEAQAAARARRREARIAALEASIRKLSEELKSLKAEDDRDER